MRTLRFKAKRWVAVAALVTTALFGVPISPDVANANGYHSKGGVMTHPVSGCTVGSVLGYNSINPRLVYAYTSTAKASAGGCQHQGAILIADLFGGQQQTGLACTVNYGAGGTYVTPLLYGNPVLSVHPFGNTYCDVQGQVVWSPLPWHP